MPIVKFILYLYKGEQTIAFKVSYNYSIWLDKDHIKLSITDLLIDVLDGLVHTNIIDDYDLVAEKEDYDHIIGVPKYDTNSD